MRKLICTLLAAAPLAFACWAARAETTNSTLTFYVVSEQQVESWRLIDTPELPKVGYIADRPDLIITNLLEVFPNESTDHAIMVGKDGKHSAVPFRAPPALTVVLRPEDGKRFMALTARSIGKRLLLMLGERPLTAPRVMTPIEGGRFLIEFEDRANLEKTEGDLKKLIQ